jgi:hypothetical protein
MMKKRNSEVGVIESVFAKESAGARQEFPPVLWIAWWLRQRADHV